MRLFLKIIKYTFILFVFAFTITGFFVFRWVQSLPIPDFETFDERKVVQSTKIYDRTGKNLLYDIHENIIRTVILYEKIPRNVKNATVAIEDSNFYQHNGVSFVGMARSLLRNLKAGELRGQGGSTITQQLVKNALLTPEKTFTRKVKEIVVALKLEKIFTKEEILTLYLNEIPYGGSTYGIEAAAQSFFGKPAIDLTLAESAYLAALPQLPTYYSPYGYHRDELDDRKNMVLNRMFELSFITEEELLPALNEEVVFLSRPEKGIKAPHFVMYIKSYLEEKYGKDLVEQGGLSVTTTIDLDLQETAEDIVYKYAKENEEKFNAKNAGLVGIDPKTGQILVMVGSRDYFDTEYEGKFNISLAERQPGSSFKPFVYATAFKKGYTPETTVFDLETEFNSSCNPNGTPGPNAQEDECYMPGNYDNIFRGPVTLKNALAQSINIPAVKTLYLAGVKESIETAQDLGITTLGKPSQYGLTLVLGGGEVNLLEMTGAYSVFANRGTKNNTTGILKVVDGSGVLLEEFKPNPQRVLDENIANTITEILSDNDARTPAFGSQSWLYFPNRDVAVKTGTTNDYRDAWVMGYTPNFSLGVWVGNNDNSSMEKKVAGFIAAPMWNAFFNKVLEKLPEENFTKPYVGYEQENLKPVLCGIWQGGNKYKIDSITKKLATEYTPPDLIEEKIITQVHSILYWVDKNNPTGEIPEHPETDSQFALWEEPVRRWVQNQNIKEETEEDIPKEFDSVHKPEFAPTIEVLEPKPNQIFKKGDFIMVNIKTTSIFGIEQVDYYLDDQYYGTSKPPVFMFVYDTNTINTEKNTFFIKLSVTDKMKNRSEFSLPITIE